MTSEELAAVLKGMPLKPLIEALQIVDPDLYKVFESVNMVRTHGFGRVTVTVVNSQVVTIEPAITFKLR